MAMNYKESDFYYPILSILRDGVEGRSASEILQIIIITKNMDAHRLPELWSSYRLKIKNLIRVAKAHLVDAGYILKRIDKNGWHLSKKGNTVQLTEQELIKEVRMIVRKNQETYKSTFVIGQDGKILKENTSRDQLRRKKEYNYGHNIIFYGPPSTGKTQQAINRALDLLNINLKEDFKILKQELFRKHLGGRFEFVTFHKSYTYGHFIQQQEGTNYKDGIFKKFVDRARYHYEAYHYKHHDHAPSIKILLEALWKKHLNEEIEQIEITIPQAKLYGSILISEITETTIYYHRKTKKDIILNEVRKLDLNTIKTLFLTMKYSYDPLNGVYYNAIVEALSQVSKKDINMDNFPDTLTNYVMIIDEINQPQTLSIFGELVSLLCEDKRLGNSNEIFIKLASGEHFALPPNIYIIGTMNTSSESLSHIDSTLRSSFEMFPMYPKCHIEGVNHTDFLKILNTTIREKKGADYTIGQGFFLSQEGAFELVRVLNCKIIPMLNEYFSFHLDKVKKILNDALDNAPSTTSKYEVEEDKEFFLRAIRSRKR